MRQAQPDDPDTKCLAVLGPAAEALRWMFVTGTSVPSTETTEQHIQRCVAEAVADIEGLPRAAVLWASALDSALKGVAKVRCPAPSFPCPAVLLIERGPGDRGIRGSYGWRVSTSIAS